MLVELGVAFSAFSKAASRVERETITAELEVAGPGAETGVAALKTGVTVAGTVTGSVVPISVVTGAGGVSAEIEGPAGVEVLSNRARWLLVGVAITCTEGTDTSFAWQSGSLEAGRFCKRAC